MESCLHWVKMNCIGLGQFLILIKVDQFVGVHFCQRRFELVDKYFWAVVKVSVSIFNYL